MTEELVSRKYLIDEIAKVQASLETDNDAMWEINQKYYKGLSLAHRIVTDAPAVKDREVYGRWIANRICSNCRKELTEWAAQNGYHFCPNCGANMDGPVVWREDIT